MTSVVPAAMIVDATRTAATSAFGRTFMFLTKLAWKSRLTLPMMITAAFLAMDFRMQVEINVHTERMAFQVTRHREKEKERDQQSADVCRNVENAYQLYDSFFFFVQLSCIA